MSVGNRVNNLTSAKTGMNILGGQMHLNMPITDKGYIACIAFFLFQHRQAFCFGVKANDLAIKAVHFRNLAGGKINMMQR